MKIRSFGFAVAIGVSAAGANHLLKKYFRLVRRGKKQVSATELKRCLESIIEPIGNDYNCDLRQNVKDFLQKNLTYSEVRNLEHVIDSLAQENKDAGNYQAYLSLSSISREVKDFMPVKNSIYDLVNSNELRPKEKDEILKEGIKNV